MNTSTQFQTFAKIDPRKVTVVIAPLVAAVAIHLVAFRLATGTTPGIETLVDPLNTHYIQTGFLWLAGAIGLTKNLAKVILAFAAILCVPILIHNFQMTLQMWGAMFTLIPGSYAALYLALLPVDRMLRGQRSA